MRALRFLVTCGVAALVLAATVALLAPQLRDALTAAREAAWLYRHARHIHGRVHDNEVSRAERLVARLTGAIEETDNAGRPSDPQAEG